MKERKYLKLFLKNGFKFEGYELSRDANFICLLDHKTKQQRFISISDISNFEILIGVKNDK